MGKINNLRLWFIFFLYTFCVSAFVQMILLPYVFPGLHVGSGLFNCSFDSMGFHELALEQSRKIHAQGWSAWQLRPTDHVISGIASIFYVFLPDARIFIPLNAALHASAALVLVNLLNLFVKNKTRAVFCVLPFLVFPSNLQWTAQLHKDIFSILGVSLLLYGMASLAGPEKDKAENRFFINFYSIIFSLSGLILIWFVRSYMLTVMTPFIILSFSLLFLVFLAMSLKKKILWPKTALILLYTIFMIFALTRLHSDSLERKAGKPQSIAEKPVPQNISAPVQSPVIAEVNTKTTAEIDTKTPAEIDTKTMIKKDDVENHWKRPSWLPLFIDRKAFYLAQIRRGFRSGAPGARSNIDHDIGFGSVKDILGYLPRAAQIAFLAPFPTQWFSEGTYQGSYLMRKIASCEMMVIYFALLFLPCAIWHWRKRIEIWIIFVFCVYMMLIYGLVICNIGTLYRMRYPYITTLTALGIAGFMVFLDNLKAKKRQ